MIEGKISSKMAECAAVRCNQERRLVRKELQRWGKNLLFLVGFERVAQEMMSRKRSKCLGEAMNITTNSQMPSMGLSVAPVLRPGMEGYTEPVDFLVDDRTCYICKNKLHCSQNTSCSPEPSAALGNDDLPNSPPASELSTESICTCDPPIESGLCPNCSKGSTTSGLVLDSNSLNLLLQQHQLRPSSSPPTPEALALSLLTSPASATTSGHQQHHDQPLDLTVHSRSRKLQPTNSSAASVQSSSTSNGPRAGRGGNSAKVQKSAPSAALLKVPSSPATATNRRTKEEGGSSGTWNRAYSEQELAAALNDIVSKKLGTRRAAVIYNIPRSTLRNKVYKLNNEKLKSQQQNGTASPDSSTISPKAAGKVTGRGRKANAAATVSASAHVVIKKEPLEEATSLLKNNSSKKDTFASDSLKQMLRQTISNKNGSSSSSSSVRGGEARLNNQTSSLFGHLPQRGGGSKVQGHNSNGLRDDLSTSSDTATLSMFQSLFNANPMYLAAIAMQQAGAAGLDQAALMAYFQEYLLHQARQMGSKHELSANFGGSRSMDMDVVQGLVKKEVERAANLSGSGNSPKCNQVKREPEPSDDDLSDSETADHEDGSNAVDDFETSDDNGNVILKVPSFKPKKKNSSSRDHEPSTDQRPSSGDDIGSGVDSDKFASTVGMEASAPSSQLSSGSMMGQSGQQPLKAKEALSRRSSLPRGAKGVQPESPGQHTPSSATAMMMSNYASSLNSEESSSEALTLTTGSVDKSRSNSVGGGGGGGGFGSGSLLNSDNSNPSTPDSKRNRPKRGQYRKYNRTDLDKAVSAVKSGEMSVHRAGTYFGVPHSTLEYKVKDRQSMRPKKRPTSGESANGGSAAKNNRRTLSTESNNGSSNNANLAALLSDSNNNHLGPVNAAAMAIWPSILKVSSEQSGSNGSSNSLTATSRLQQYAVMASVGQNSSKGGSGLLSSFIEAALDRPTYPMEGTEAPLDSSNSTSGPPAGLSPLNSSLAALQEVSALDKKD